MLYQRINGKITELDLALFGTQSERETYRKSILNHPTKIPDPSDRPKNLLYKEYTSRKREIK